MRITFLGTGTSTGVPVLGCDCPVCTSADPRNKRLRPSVLVGIGEKNLLIDTSPDLRYQLMRARVGQLDAIIITHEHADHLHGIDDVRPLNFRRRGAIPLHTTARVSRLLERKFAYAFGEYGTRGVPSLQRIEIRMHEPFELFGERVLPLPLLHAGTEVVALRFETWAYVVDVNEIPDRTLAELHGLDLLVLDALRQKPHPSHLSIDEALAVVESLAPKRTLFSHMTHDIDHERDSALLPEGVAFAVDGLVVDV